ncbi:hypothetical protein GCM10009700_35390 [Brevibacterium sanguinis]|uniref:HNH endonuclease n=1 Tax=Brevibacterium sanguinis TaxID=232444 RepID=UPI00336EE062
MARVCEWCAADISHKRIDAIYCDRVCKSRAATERHNARKSAEDRSRENSERYLRERERRLEYARAYYWATAEYRREYSRAWRRANPEARRAQRLKRDSLKKAAECRTVTADDLKRITNRQRGKCYYCQAEADLVFDHIVPLAKGGRHAIGNLVGACDHCNSQKSAMLLVEWRRFLFRRGVSLTL